jgi:hypothetical protein
MLFLVHLQILVFTISRKRLKNIIQVTFSSKNDDIKLESIDTAVFEKYETAILPHLIGGVLTSLINILKA